MYVGDILITSLETITGFGLNGGNFLFALDELQNGSIANTEETSDITGKAGRKLAKLKKNKGATVSATNGMLSSGLLEAQTGGAFENKATEVMWTDYLTVNASHKAYTNYTGIANNLPSGGDEIINLFLKDKDGVAVTELVQGTETGTGKFTYNPATKELAFATGVEAGTEIVVRYKRRIVADVLANDGDRFATKCTLYVDAFGEDKCGNIFRVQIYFPKADVSGEFSFDMGDNQTVHAFEAEALTGACGAAGQLWTYTIFGADSGDTPALSSIAITTAPTTTSYSAGQAFSNAGMVVTATFDDGSSSVVTDYTYAPVGALAAGTTSVTISYTRGNVTKTATQAITVSE